MDLNQFLHKLENCPCGKKHSFYTKTVEIGSGLTARTGEILRHAGFGDALFLVSNRSTMQVSSGLLESLRDAGFTVTQLIYENVKNATAERVREVEALAASVDGIISVGTGSLNDICRVAAYELKKKFAIFATAPSMDGFVSDMAPIVENNFKSSWQAEQPLVIIGDTTILAKAPPVLKAAGFGDLIAKYTALADWRIAHLLTDEYYCPTIAAITKEATDRVAALADRITEESEEAAGALMESLIKTGLAMKLAGYSRPASGAEHMVSHYLECHMVIKGLWPDYHGRKVGVAAVYCNRLYRNLAEQLETVHCTADSTDWADVYAHYDPLMHQDIKKLNQPPLTDQINPADIEEKWPEIRKIILETIPDKQKMITLMRAAGAPTDAEEIHIAPAFMADAMRYHPYMRDRLVLTRLLPMLGINPMDYCLK